MPSSSALEGALELRGRSPDPGRPLPVIASRRAGHDACRTGLFPARYVDILNVESLKGTIMNTNIILAVIAIIFGILVITVEGLLRWIVGIVFILLGIWLLWDTYEGSKKTS